MAKKAENKTLRQSDLSGAITNPKGETDNRKYKKQTLYYDVAGSVNGSIKDDGAAAIETHIGPQRIYKVKTKRGGKLYNPLTDGKGGLATIDRTSGNTKFDFKEVNAQAFNSYIKFLQTGYDSYLLAAEREV
jgi:hypothetical protein